MLDVTLRLLRDYGWVVWASLFVLMDIILEMKLGKKRARFVIAGFILIYVGSIFMGMPVNHTFRCSHKAGSCLETSTNISGKVETEQFFRLADVSDMYVKKNVWYEKSVKKTSYWLVVKANGEEHLIDAAQNIERLPYKAFKDFLQNKQSPDYLDTSDALLFVIYLGTGFIFVALLIIALALFWPRLSIVFNLPKVGEVASLAAMPIGCIFYFIWGALQYAAIAAYFLQVLKWHWIIVIPVAVFSASIPILGSLLGIIGATQVWHWPLLGAICLYFGQYFLYFGLYFLFGILALFSKR
jgi:hypothetical protein